MGLGMSDSCCEKCMASDIKSPHPIWVFFQCKICQRPVPCNISAVWHDTHGISMLG